MDTTLCHSSASRGIEWHIPAALHPILGSFVVATTVCSQSGRCGYGRKAVTTLLFQVFSILWYKMLLAWSHYWNILSLVVAQNIIIVSVAYSHSSLLLSICRWTIPNSQHPPVAPFCGFSSQSWTTLGPLRISVRRHQWLDGWPFSRLTKSPEAGEQLSLT